MIALWIIGVLLALIVLLCWNRVGVHAVFGDELLLDARIGVFHIHILPGKEPDKEKKKREKKETVVEEADSVDGLQTLTMLEEELAQTERYLEENA